MTRHNFISILFVLLTTSISVFLLGGTTHAKPTSSTFDVNDTTDLIDDNLADGSCHSATGTCTLRAAIMQANALGGANTINVPSGVYTLTIAGANEDFAATGDLDIRSDLTINGAGADVTVIDGNQLDRVFDLLTPENVNVQSRTIRNLSIQNGRAIAGGGIRNIASLALDNMKVFSNTASNQGGGIYNSGILANLSATNIALSFNEATDGGGVFSDSLARLTLYNFDINNNSSSIGGGIESSGFLLLDQGTIKHNRSTLAVAGILSGGTAILTNIVIASNVVSGTSAIGGGFGNAGEATLTGISIVSNTATYHSGGIVNGGILTITNSTIQGNSAVYEAGISSRGKLVIIASSILSNTASGTGGGLGTNDNATLSNVTFSGNAAQYAGSAIESAGTITLTNVTFTGNTITNTQAGGMGGTIYVDYNITSSVTLKNTIISNSTLGGNCAVVTGTILSLGHNLSSDNTCNLTATGDMTNTNPLLGPLQNNGGATLTHALLPGSPAINAGDNNGCPSADQRGVPRPQAGVCDIGAYEFVFPFLRYLPFITR